MRKPYLLFFAVRLCGEAAYQVQSVAIAWQIYTLHHRVLDLGYVGLALFLPVLLFALTAGSSADRYDRRVLMIIALLAEATVILGLAVLTHLQITDLWPYLGLLVAIGTIRAFGAPAERAILPMLVKPDKFFAVQSRYSMLKMMVTIIAPAAGGVLVAFGTNAALYLACGLLGLAAALLSQLPLLSRSATSSQPRGVLAGARHLYTDKVLLGAISLDLFAVLFGGVTAFLPVFASTVYHAGPFGLGILRSAPAFGGAVTAAYLSLRPLRRHIGRTLFLTVSAFGCATIAFGYTRFLPFGLVCLAIIGGADMVSVVIRTSLVAARTPDYLRGRVSAIENIFIGASNELGECESGFFGAAIGVIPAVILSGVGTLIVIVTCAMTFPRLLRADTIDEANHAVSAS